MLTHSTWHFPGTRTARQIGLGLAILAGPAAASHAQERREFWTPEELPLSREAPFRETRPGTGRDAEEGIARGDIAPPMLPLVMWPADAARPFEPLPPSAFDSGLDRRPPRVTQGITPEGLRLTMGEDAPYVVRYACCDDLELYAGANFNAPVIERMEVSSEVWVYDFLGAGLPQGIADCGGVPAPCPHIWAEVFSNDLSRSGYMPLSSLFARPMMGEAGQTTFEIGYGELNRRLAAALQPLLRPAGCETPDDTITLHGHDFGHRDAFFDRNTGEGRLCQELINRRPEVALLSCSGINSDHPAFGGCLYRDPGECLAEMTPSRAPSTNLSACLITPVIGAGTCSDCRAWYDETGQTDSGALTQDELLLACERRLQNDDSVICEKGNCASQCAQRVRLHMGAACTNYIGEVDTRFFGNPVDYRCGEVPVGRTHPFREHNILTDTFLGEADPDSKLLHIWGMPNLRFPTLESTLGRDLPVAVTMGRLDAQRPFRFSIPDLTTHGTREVNAPATLDLVQIWYRLWPDRDRVTIEGTRRNVRTLTARVCGFLPGSRIDLGQVVFNQNEGGLWAVVRKIDFGVVDFRHIGVCMNMQAYIDPTASNLAADDVTVELIEVTHVDIPDVTIEGIGFEWGPAAATPFLDHVFALVAISSEHAAAFFNTFDSPVERRFIDMAKSRLTDRLIDLVAPRIEDALTDALMDARANFDGSLSDVCDIIAPDAPRNHPLHFLYRYIDWNCAEIISRNQIRPFVRNAASTEAGCYDVNEYITPADFGRRAWWADYVGQEWYWAGLPDQGCRIAAELSARPDRAMWRPLRCATMVFNAWANDGAVPGRVLARMVADNCWQHGAASLRDLYGDGADLLDLYHTVHPPAGGLAPVGRLRED